MTQKTTNKTIGELEQRRRAYENAVAGLLGVVRKNADFAWPPTGSEATDAEPIGATPSLRYAAYKGIIYAIDNALAMLLHGAKSDVLTFETIAGAPHEKYMDNEKWAACGKADAPFRYAVGRLAGKRCYVGIDRISESHTISLSFVFPYVDGGTSKYAVYCYSLFDNNHSEVKPEYQEYVRAGYFDVLPGMGNMTLETLAVVLSILRSNDWFATCICVDPFFFPEAERAIKGHDIRVVYIRQRSLTLSGPTKAFREAVYSRRVIHDNNPVLTWAVGNAEIRADMVLSKPESRGNICPLTATINAFVLAMHDRRMFDEAIVAHKQRAKGLPRKMEAAAK